MKDRIVSVNQLLKKELADILLREGDIPEGALVTVTKAEAYPNLQEARIYIRVMPEARTREALNSLKKQIYEIQQMLNKRLKMRPVPKIRWMEDREGLKEEHLEKLFEKIQE